MIIFVTLGCQSANNKPKEQIPRTSDLCGVKPKSIGSFFLTTLKKNIRREKKDHKHTYGMFVCAVEQVMNPGHTYHQY